jgi:hypothetical protein
MSRDFGTEIDSLKQDLEEIKTLLKAPQRKYPAIRERGEMPEGGNIEIEKLKEFARETGNERTENARKINTIKNNNSIF